MNSTTPTRTLRESASLAVAALAAVLLAALAPSARAMPPFGAADSLVKQIFCDLNSVNGTFTSTEATYRASGQCVELE